jgi:16S rRNA (adenine1518-N6/adenine1519-N6)-dimethyltransferase
MKKTEILSLLNKYSISIKKSLGQNFLMDANVVKKIVQTANPRINECIIEIGPGLGILTEELAKTKAAITSIEIDSKLISLLKNELKNYSNIKIINKDALKFSPPKCQYKVVANLPYYITSPLISHFLNAKNKPKKLVILIQKEVAEKICAKSPNLNVLAINVQVFGKPKIIMKVSKKSFYPIPKVDSAVLEIKMHKQPLIKEKNIKKFFKIVHAGFSQKRKTILNALSNNLSIKTEKIKEALKKCPIKSTERAQNLTIEDWEKLTINLKEYL